MATPFHLGDPHTDVHPTAFVATTATLVGDVTVGQHSSIWFGAVLRADLAPIVVGTHSSIQDGAVVHVDDNSPTRIGNHVTVGHGAIVHGCTIDDNVLIGIRAVVLSRAHIGANSIIGACALVTEDMHIPPHSLVIGVPGRVVTTLTPTHQGYVQYAQEEYVALCQAYKHHRSDLDQMQHGNASSENRS